MHEILGMPLVYYSIRLAQEIGSTMIGVVGHGREVVGPYMDTFSITQVVQDPPLGTGHASDPSTRQTSTSDAQP